MRARLFTRRFTLLLALLGALSLGAGDPPAEQPPELPTVDLADLRRDRSQWLGKELRFTFQLSAELETWRPWVTRFGVEDYRAFSVWADSALLWELADFKDTTPHVFVRRGTLAAQMMEKRAYYERFEVRAIVRSIFLDEPWIELLEVRPLRESVSQGTVLHGERALKLIAEKHYELALGELERARAGRLPERAKAELVRLEAECRAKLGAN